MPGLSNSEGNDSNISWSEFWVTAVLVFPVESRVSVPLLQMEPIEVLGCAECSSMVMM